MVVLRSRKELSERFRARVEVSGPHNAIFVVWGEAKRRLSLLLLKPLRGSLLLRSLQGGNADIYLLKNET